jgi:hypothetical protein
MIKRQSENSGGGLRLARHNLREITLMILALLVGLGILLLVAPRLMHIAIRRSTAGTAGIGAVAGGISIPLFSFAIVVLAIVVVLAIFLWRR